jgi:hypothetical protein
LFLFSHADVIPKLHSRLDYRNAFLFVGNVCLLALLLELGSELELTPKQLFTQIATQNGYDLVWPNGPSFLDAPFSLFQTARQEKFTAQCFALVFFVSSMVLHHGYVEEKPEALSSLTDAALREEQVVSFGSLAWSRLMVYVGTFCVLYASMVASLPDCTCVTFTVSLFSYCEW